MDYYGILLVLYSFYHFTRMPNLAVLVILSGEGIGNRYQFRRSLSGPMTAEQRQLPDARREGCWSRRVVAHSRAQHPA